MPWQKDAAEDGAKYSYHPQVCNYGIQILQTVSNSKKGDPRNPPKDAPSALHSVIVPNVNLPKVSLHYLQAMKTGRPEEYWIVI